MIPFSSLIVIHLKQKQGETFCLKSMRERERQKDMKNYKSITTLS